MKSDNFTFGYDDNIVFKNFSFDFTNGKYMLIGENGSGKTTLLNYLKDNFTELTELQNEEIYYVKQTPLLLNELSVSANIEIVCHFDKKKIDDTKKFLEYLKFDSSTKSYFQN